MNTKFIATLGNILTGGFAKGWRTEILVTMSVITIIVNYAVGDATLVNTIGAIAAALAALTAKAAIK